MGVKGAVSLALKRAAPRGMQNWSCAVLPFRLLVKQFLGKSGCGGGRFEHKHKIKSLIAGSVSACAFSLHACCN